MQSTLRFLAAALLLALCSAFPQHSHAAPGEPAHGLFDRIAKAQQAGREFRPVTLFASGGGAAHSDILKQESLLQPVGAEISAMFQSKPEAISLTLHAAGGQAYTLLMLRSYPTPEKPDMGVYDAKGRHRCGYDPGLHYQGIVNGEMHSMAALSIFENGEVMGLFANGDGNFNLGKLEDGSGRYILYNDKDMLHHPATPCATLDEDVRPPMPGIKTAKQANAMECSKVRLYWEVDSTIYRYKITLSNTQNYVTGLFNQFQAMYANEHIAVELSSMYVWTGLSIYPTSGSDAGLYTFTSFWNSMGAGFDGDLAHVLMRTNNGNGGRAWLGGLCKTNGYAYGYSDVHGSYATIPTFSWDVEVITHETGHNLGSNHTHWCGWMTNGGSCGAIDNCYTLETSPCFCSYSQYSNSASPASWAGTVMSYCHLVSRGINLANGFGPLPGDAIRNYVSNASCLSPALDATLTPSAICSNDGTVAVQLAGSVFSTAPYSFNWNSGARTQNLAGLSAAGTYTVTVSDSNGCSNSFSAVVKQGRAAGNGIAPQVAMPVCCNSNAPLVLNASAPKGLGTCQTVYWLRSNAPFSSAQEASAYFDTASAANVLASSNASAITNGVTGAELQVEPESCSVAKTWYYTPVVARLAHSADSIVYTSTGSTAFLSYNNVRIGGETSIPDQRAAATACDLQDVSAQRSLKVTVTSYTGRPNQMRIFIADANGLVLYQSQNLAGNGIYIIPDSLISGDFLQALDVVAYDYYCTTSTTTRNTTCNASQCNVVAERKVVYDAHPARLTNDCALGQSIRVDWAPAGCTQLAVAPQPFVSGVKLLPNPASNSATLYFALSQPAQLRWTMSDMAGRIILSGGGHYDAGAQQARIDLKPVARGIYMISLSDGGAALQRAKLVVE